MASTESEGPTLPFSGQPSVNATPRVVVPVPSIKRPSLDGYDVLDPLGNGGMGVVWRGVQLSTKRKVALKFLNASHFGSERARLRFDREVELTARLEHPNIARLYDSGINDSVQYYAMELIEGQHLDAYTKAARLNDNECVQLVIQVCRAVQFAHQKGVIHRDLKPSNVMVTRHGQVKVMDFGLAKSLFSETGEETDAPSPLTMEVGVGGTPGYMAPEQAAGRHSQMDTRTDVYALGAMLYVLLCRAFPHDMSGPVYEVLRRVAEQEPRRPRQARADLDVELEAIILKALAHNPDQRYATAGELADDLERYLADEPVTARSQTTMYIVRKKLTKHRGKVLVAAMALLLLAGGVAYANLLIVRQRNEAVAQRDRAVLAEQQAQAARKVAEQNLADAEAAVEQFCSRIGQESLANIPGMMPLREQFLRDAAAYYQRLTERSPDNVALRAQYAGVLSQLGLFGRQSGNVALAIQNLEQARTILESLSRESPDDEKYRRNLGFALNDLSYLYDRNGQKTEAGQTAQQAAQILGQLAAEHPDDNRYRQYEGRTLAQATTQQRRSGDTDAAWQTAVDGIKAKEQLVAENPGKPGPQRELAFAYSDLAKVELNRGQDDEARRLIEKSVEGLRRLVKQYPLATDYKSFLEIGYGTWGEIARLSGRLDEAEQMTRESLKLSREVAEANPAVAKHQHYLARNYGELAKIYLRQGKAQEAFDSSKQGLALMQKVCADQPQDQDLAYSMIYACTLVAESAGAAMKPEEAARAAASARELEAKLTSPAPGSRRRFILTGRVESASGWAYQVNGQTEQARAAFTRAIESLRQLPDERKFRADLTHLEQTLATLSGSPRATDTTVTSAAAAPPATPPPALKATDHEAIRAAVSKVVTIEGEVSRIGLSRSGTVTFINFKGVPRDGFVAIVRDTELAFVQAAFGGNLTESLTGRKIRLTGQIVLYRDIPEIKVTRPDQIEVIAQ
jgi:tetratricopeptide (TPR) repeat protein